VNAIDGFGNNNDLPWIRSATDMKRFRDLTTGHTVVMGSGTWNSNMPKPLPRRRNIVISSKVHDPRCEVYPSVTDAMMHIPESETVFVIGGAKLLWTFRPFINRIYLTRFNSKDECDVTLDTKRYLEDFKLVSDEVLDNHTFEIYDRIQ
jgi:dihydrofolate reductase